MVKGRKSLWGCAFHTEDMWDFSQVATMKGPNLLEGCSVCVCVWGDSMTGWGQGRKGGEAESYARHVYKVNGQCG